MLSGTAAAMVAAFAYVGGLRLVEYFVEPSVAPVSGDTFIGPWVLVATLVAVAAGIGLVRFGTRIGLPDLQPASQRLVARLTTAGIDDRTARSAPSGWSVPSAGPPDDSRRASLRADVDRAGDIVAPQWPLASFVAVNPLSRLEPKGFDAASALARRWLRARTHLSLDEYRRDHRQGLTTHDDLEYAALDRHLEVCAREPVRIGGRSVDPLEIVVADLLHGPDADPVDEPRTVLERAGRDDLAEIVDRATARILTAYVVPPAWPIVRPGEGVVAAARRLAMCDPVLARCIDRGASAWLDGLSDDPAAVLDAALAASGVDDDGRVDELRGHLARLQGWAGLARWRNEWAPHRDPHPQLAPIEVISVRALFEALVAGSNDALGAGAIAVPTAADDELLGRRVAAVVDVVAPGADAAGREIVASVLADVPADSRASVWLAAQEHRLDAGLLSVLERPDPGQTSDRPDAQVVFCIDVRSEGLRRHLEVFDGVETRGFAGFFGVPMAIRKLGWAHDEPRCPVLVAPAVTAQEQATVDGVGEVAAALGRRRALAGVNSAHGTAKRAAGAPFVLAEALGWLLGPLAAKRTLWPGRAAAPAPAPTRMVFDDDEALVEQRVFLAESVLTTMGLTSGFAPVVVLCGHTSVTTNNPHATALECGACAGAAGDDNARAVATLLNSADVRHGLLERGIEIPDDTWFAAGLHDTASDHVTIIDARHAPAESTSRLHTLQRQLDAAGRLQSGAAGRRSSRIDGAGPRSRGRLGPGSP